MKILLKKIINKDKLIGRSFNIKKWKGHRKCIVQNNNNNVTIK